MTSDRFEIDHATGDAIGDAIEVLLPARTELAATVRVLTASLGADVGLSVDEIDDVRLAVNEVFASAADHSPGDRISIRLRPGDGRLDVAIGLVDGNPIRLDQLAATVLRSVVELAEDGDTADAATVTFSKRATEAAR